MRLATPIIKSPPTLVKTGWAAELPTIAPWALTREAVITFEAQIRPRSGMALKHGIQVLNSPGTVDNSYRGEIGVILMWSGHAPNAVNDYMCECVELSSQLRLVKEDPQLWRIVETLPVHMRAKGAAYRIRKGDRIAQLVVAPVVLCGAEWADKLSATDRGGSGFGSTGK